MTALAASPRTVSWHVVAEGQFTRVRSSSSSSPTPPCSSTLVAGPRPDQLGHVPASSDVTAVTAADGVQGELAVGGFMSVGGDGGGREQLIDVSCW